MLQNLLVLFLCVSAAFSTPILEARENGGLVNLDRRAAVRLYKGVNSEDTTFRQAVVLDKGPGTLSGPNGAWYGSPDREVAFQWAKLAGGWQNVPKKVVIHEYDLETTGLTFYDFYAGRTAQTAREAVTEYGRHLKAGTAMPNGPKGTEDYIIAPMVDMEDLGNNARQYALQTPKAISAMKHVDSKVHKVKKNKNNKPCIIC